MPCKSWNLLFLRFDCEFYDFQFKRNTFAEMPTCDVKLARARLKFYQPFSELLCLLISLLFHFGRTEKLSSFERIFLPSIIH